MDNDRPMKKETAFIKSMTKKLKKEGDVSENEALYIFILATVVYAYEMGWNYATRYDASFNYRFDFSELSEALGKWYEEVLSRISDFRAPEKYRNFIGSIPSNMACPPLTYATSPGSHVAKAMEKVRQWKVDALEKSFRTSDFVCANKKMADWIKDNVPLSFDVSYHVMYHELGNVTFARFGVLGSLPFYEREVDEETFWKLSEIGAVPFLQCNSVVKGKTLYAVACPVEYKDLLNAAVDGKSVSEEIKTSARVPKDLSYINSLISRLPAKDITLEEADNLYLLLKMYQALKIAAQKAHSPETRREALKATDPGLEALRSWYERVETSLKRKRRGNFIYTLPNNMNMPLFQLGKQVKRCLKMLPKEPLEVTMRNEHSFPVKDVFLDARRLVINQAPAFPNKYVRYLSNRYGFFDRNDIDINEWKPVARCEDSNGEYMFDNMYGSPTLGKLRFAESLGIRFIVMEKNTVAVRKDDLEKTLEILSVPDDEVVQAAMFAVKRDEETRKKTGVPVEEWLKHIGENCIPLMYMQQGAEIAYNRQKEKKEYLDEYEWMVMDR
jgi:hypothetical protein